MARILFCFLATCTGIVVGVVPAFGQLNFAITNQGSATEQMMNGFAEAAVLWSTRFSDPITINIRIRSAALPAGQIAGTSNFFDPYAYQSVRFAMMADRTSLDDMIGTKHMQFGNGIKLLINRTANNPFGIVSATPYFDTGLGGPGDAGPDNNVTIRITSANAKALGLIPGNLTGLDGTITISNSVLFDFDRSNGIDPNRIDFVGVAAHEIGHLLGFISGVDNLDRNGTSPGLLDSQLKFVTPLDLFRFSSRSIGIGGGMGVIDWTADNTAKYFSVDGGMTAIAPMANGAIFGDGHEPHHWKNGFGIGLMNPTASSGQMLEFSNTDLRAFDVIGYNRLPDPASIIAITLAMFGLKVPGKN